MSYKKKKEKQKRGKTQRIVGPSSSDIPVRPLNPRAVYWLIYTCVHYACANAFDEISSREKKKLKRIPGILFAPGRVSTTHVFLYSRWHVL